MILNLFIRFVTIRQVLLAFLPKIAISTKAYFLPKVYYFIIRVNATSGPLSGSISLLISDRPVGHNTYVGTLP